MARQPVRTQWTDREADAQLAKRRSVRPLVRLLPFILRHPVRLALTVVFLLISAIASLAIPAIAGGLIDEGFVGRNLEQITSYAWVIIAVAAITAAASGARFYFISVIGERVMTDLRRAVFDHLLTLDTVFFDTHRVGELAARLNGDVAVVRSTIGTNASLTLRSTVLMIGAVTMTFLTSPFLATMVVVAGPLIIFPLLFVTRRLRGLSRRTQDALADLSAMATEALAASRTVKAFGQEAEQSRIFAIGSEDSYKAETQRLLARGGIVALVMFLTALALVGMVWWGPRAVFDGVVTTGDLVQFMIYALMAATSLTSIAEMLGVLQIAAGATERLLEILDTKPALVAPATPSRLPTPPLGTLAFEDVSFSYPNRERDLVLDHVSFAVGQGETVALVGPSGAGKSTIFALIERFYDVAAGRVLVDGVDVRTLEPQHLRSRFAYVEQEPVIFAGTIADNIRFGRPDASDEEVRAAARAALVDDYVTQLADGYETLVGERGIMLSGGQKQRLAIARALLKDAPILLLDEATSALDAQSEALVQTALSRLMEGRTTLVIAHRLATIRDADRILVLEGGRIIGQGTHEHLVRQGGRYAELTRLQFRPEPQAAE